MSVTLLIATYNRAHLLEKTLARLKELTLPNELIVVDDGGTDNTKQVCGQSGLAMTYVYTNNPGEDNCCHARNVGLKLATSEFLITSEPEVLFITNVIPQLLAAHAQHPNDFLHGWCEHEDEDENQQPNGEHTMHGWPFLNFWKKQWLMDVGGWDEAMPGPWGWDDIELFERLRYAGHESTLIEGVLYRHQWHKSRIEPAVENEAYSRSREMPRDAVANVGREWGVPK